MFLRPTYRYKDGKDHRYFSVVENRRVRNGRSVQKTLLYLGEINDSQKAGWVKAIEVVEGKQNRQMSLFPDDSAVPEGVENGIQLVMSELELRRPRQWGACWHVLVYPRYDIPVNKTFKEYGPTSKNPAPAYPEGPRTKLWIFNGTTNEPKNHPFVPVPYETFDPATAYN